MNLLNEAAHSKFMTRKWNIAMDQSNANYDIENETFYKTELIKSNLGDYKDAYISARVILLLQDVILRLNQYLKIVYYSLSVSQELMERK